MRTLVCLALSVPLLLIGCAGRTTGPVFAPLPDERVIVTAQSGLAGKVIKMNSEGRFVILNFPIGHLPALEQRMNVYRRGLKVGEVKITGPQMDDDIVGDLVSGEALAGDEVRDR
jgi:hypothetical protein